MISEIIEEDDYKEVDPVFMKKVMEKCMVTMS
jgi:hypothetical protein